MTGETAPPADQRHLDMQAALARLAERYETGTTSRVGPGVEAVAMAWRETHHDDGRLRGGELPTDPPDIDDIRDALLLSGRHLDEAAKVRADLIRAARAPGPDGRPALTWRAIGLLLGHPESSSRQGARQLAERLGLGPGPDD